MAALSVHSARAGTCTLAPSEPSRRRSSPLAATPPPIARRPIRLVQAPLGALDQAVDDRRLVGGREVGARRSISATDMSRSR